MTVNVSEAGLQGLWGSRFLKSLLATCSSPDVASRAPPSRSAYGPGTVSPSDKERARVSGGGIVEEAEQK